MAAPSDAVRFRDGADTTRFLAHSALTRVPELAEWLTRTILAENVGYTDESPVPHDDLWRSCHDNLQRVLQMLAGELPEGCDPYDAPRATGRSRAKQALPLDSLLHSYRLGGRIVWEALIEHARTSGIDDSAALFDTAASVWEAMDMFSLEVAKAYRETDHELIRQDEQRRSALVEGLLHGRARDRAFAQEAARTLDLPTGGTYVVVTAETGSWREPGLRHAREALAARGIRSAWQVRTDANVGLIAVEGRSAEVAVTALRPAVCGRVGVSPGVDGLAEVGSAYQLALAALTTVPPGTAEIVSLDERLPEAIVVQAPELAERLVHTHLGGVLEAPPAERDVLLETLATWLAEGCSATQAAGRLYCHRNTVLNRLERIEALTGRSTRGPASYVAFSLALVALRLLPADGSSPVEATGRCRRHAQRDGPDPAGNGLVSGGEPEGAERGDPEPGRGR